MPHPHYLRPLYIQFLVNICLDPPPRRNLRKGKRDYRVFFNYFLPTYLSARSTTTLLFFFTLLRTKLASVCLLCSMDILESSLSHLFLLHPNVLFLNYILLLPPRANKYTRAWDIYEIGRYLSRSLDNDACLLHLSIYASLEQAQSCMLKYQIGLGV